MRSQHAVRRALAIALSLLLCGAAQAGDPPAVVGRVSWLAGGVTLQGPAGARDTAQLNLPVTSGELLATDGGGRAEVWAGPSALRLDVASTLRVVALDDAQRQFALDDGALALRVDDDGDARHSVVDTSVGRFAPQQSGAWRIDVRRDGGVDATALRGGLRFEGNGGTTVTVLGGQRVHLAPEGATVHVAFDDATHDDFAAFVGARDRAYDGVQSARHVSPQMTGIESLDHAGHWESAPEWGWVWVPLVASDWAPYRFGRWDWIEPWGWTWVDDAPWGFAPFHYGRWTLWGERWAWVPGEYVARPVYAPALVGWVGGVAPPVGVAVGARIGWFPLAPHEAYVPRYTVSASYLRGLNGPHAAFASVAVAAAPVHYVFQDNLRATTIVHADVLAERRAVAPRREAPPLLAREPLPRPLAVQRAPFEPRRLGPAPAFAPPAAIREREIERTQEHEAMRAREHEREHEHERERGPGAHER